MPRIAFQMRTMLVPQRFRRRELPSGIRHLPGEESIPSMIALRDAGKSWACSARFATTSIFAFYLVVGILATEFSRAGTLARGDGQRRSYLPRRRPRIAQTDSRTS